VYERNFKDVACLPAPELEAAGTWSQRIEALLLRIASSNVPVLLQGETGVGKEVIARRLHALSRRADRPFVKLNCAALPSELVESELFGYERGAFTGAFKNTPGKFEMAHKGTILLDEIGDMDFRLQAKLLQVLQDQEFYRLGSHEASRIDVRIMAASHCDFEKAIAERKFREDLYYRLNIVDIKIPPLRERRSEILPLCELFLQKHATTEWPKLEIDSILGQAVLEHSWPGNVRELENAMRKYLVLRNPGVLAAEIRQRTVRTKTVYVSADEYARENGNSADDFDESMSTKRGTDSTRWRAENTRRGVEPHVYRVGEMRDISNVQELPSLVPKQGLVNTGEKSPSPAQCVAERLLRSAKGADARRETGQEFASFLRGAPNTAPVLREFLSRPILVSRSASLPSHEVQSSLSKVNEARKLAEVEAILGALQSSLWNRKRAATLLNVDYKALLYKMKKLGIGEKRAMSCG
jgi:transcriptional regulator with PAS, ATPase and Fis domain